jgi:multidrug efflux system outer membrane protein
MMLRGMIERAASFASALALSSCAVGPDYHRPSTPMTASFRGEKTARPAGQGGAASLGDLPFWEVFSDERLVALLRESLHHSYDLQAAAARVEQARALAGLGTDALLPRLDVSLGPTYQQVFTPWSLAAGASGAPRGNLRYALYQLQGSLSWELDLFGRLRRLREATLAEYLASEEARRGVIVSLIGEVAKSYFELLTLDFKLAIAQRTVLARRETLELFRELEQGGVGNRLQTASEEANLAGAAAAIPSLEQQIGIKENALAVLLGRPPGPIPRRQTLESIMTPPELPVGIPASLLERRPDLRQAEAGLIAANAQVGAALAQFFPQITLSAHGGLASTAIGTLFSSSAATFGVGLLAGWLMPLLQGFELRHRYRAQQANWRALCATYRQAALNALAEVSSALYSIDKLRQERLQREAEVRARSESVELAKERFRNGVASYLEVVQAEQSLFPAELQLAETIGAQFVALTQLYRALGGGWERLQ